MSTRHPAERAIDYPAPLLYYEPRTDPIFKNTLMPPKAEKTEKAPPPEKAASDAPKLSAARDRDLEAAIPSISKAYGDGSIMRLGAAQALRKIDVIPTGALAIDLALGVGGVPRVRVVEIFGPESSGKTTLMLH